jgi:hypothetical protein
MTAKKLAQGSFDAIAFHRVAHFATDGDAQSSFVTVIRSAKDNEVSGVNLPAGS